MEKYDRHIALYNLEDLDKVKEELGDNYIEIIGSTQMLHAKAIFTLDAETEEEAASNHEKLCKLAVKLNSRVLVETESNFKLDSFLLQLKSIPGKIYRLSSEKRSDLESIGVIFILILKLIRIPRLLDLT